MKTTKQIINVMWTIFWLFYTFCGALISISNSKVAILICIFICGLLGIGIHIKTNEALE